MKELLGYLALVVLILALCAWLGFWVWIGPY